MEHHIPGFSNSSVDAKLAQLQAMKNVLAREKKDPALYDASDGKEKEIRGADTWKQVWGPTVLINALIASLWW